MRMRRKKRKSRKRRKRKRRKRRRNMWRTGKTRMPLSICIRFPSYDSCRTTVQAKMNATNATQWDLKTWRRARRFFPAKNAALR